MMPYILLIIMNVNSNLIKYLQNKIKLVHKSFSLVLMVIYLGMSMTILDYVRMIPMDQNKVFLKI